MNVNIRRMRPDEAGLLREFLYQAIYLPAGTEPPPRSVVDLPELRVYTENFGTRPGDFCLVAEVDGQVVGAAWSRIMEDYGHIDNDTPSLALSLLPDCRGQGIGTRLLNGLLALLQNQGYQRASLSVQIENPALRLEQSQKILQMPDPSEISSSSFRFGKARVFSSECPPTLPL